MILIYHSYECWLLSRTYFAILHGSALAIINWNGITHNPLFNITGKFEFES